MEIVLGDKEGLSRKRSRIIWNVVKCTLPTILVR